jgi:hypothetical protein
MLAFRAREGQRITRLHSTLGLRLRAAIVLMIVATSIVGVTFSSAMAMGQNVFVSDIGISVDQCQFGETSADTASLCDATAEGPAQKPACPMMKFCTSMGSTGGHCGVQALSETTVLPDASALVFSVVFTDNVNEGVGLTADPILHPPIV